MAEQRRQLPIYLTFDDGPDPHWTPRVLALLAAHDARATFFLVGRRALEFPGIVRQIVSAGHEIGNHSFSHRHPWLMRESVARREVRDGAASLEDMSGRPVRMFRPPHGRLRRCMTEEAALYRQALVLWHRTAIDWGPLGRHSSSIAARLDRVRPGEVVLMHDSAVGLNHPERTVRALPGLLSGLAARGLRAVSYPAPALPGEGTSAPSRRAA